MGDWIVYLVIGFMGLPLLGFIGIQVWNLRVVYLSGYYRVIFTHEDGRIEPALIRLKKDHDGSFTYKGCSYDLPVQAGYSGRWRIPSIQYVWDRKEPVNVYEMQTGSEITASRYNQAVKQKLAADLFDALKSGLIDQTSFQIIVLVGMAIGFVVSTYLIIAKLDEIAQAIGVE